MDKILNTTTKYSVRSKILNSLIVLHPINFIAKNKSGPTSASNK